MKDEINSILLSGIPWEISEAMHTRDGRMTVNDGRFRFHASLARVLPFSPVQVFRADVHSFFRIREGTFFHVLVGEQPVEMLALDFSFTLFLLYP